MAPDPRLIGETILTLSIGAAGALCFWLIGLSAAFLTGPAACVTVAALAGLRVQIPIPLRTFCFIVIGIGIGAGVDRSTLETAVSWPLSFAFLAVVQWASILAGAWILMRRFGFGREESVICAVPGLLSFVVSYAIDRGANVARVSLVQSVRVLVLALLVPVVLKVSGLDISGVTRAQSELPVFAAVGLFAIVWFLGNQLVRRGVPAAHLLTGVVIGSLGGLSGVTSGALPEEVTVCAFLIIGSLIGSRFRGLKYSELGADVLAGLVMTISAAIFALVGAVVVSNLLQIPLAPLLIAFAPGGLEVMIAMSVQLGLDPTFVAAHHVARLLILMALVPAMMKRLSGA